MKRLWLLIIILFFAASRTYGQSENPVRWTISKSKINDKVCEIHIVAEINEPWHIYAQDNDEEVAFPTQISFKKSVDFKIIGKTKEIGKLKTDTISGVVIHYYEDNVEFIQNIELEKLGKIVITGKISWMACAERCLPEAERNFSIALGEN